MRTIVDGGCHQNERADELRIVHRHADGERAAVWFERRGRSRNCESMCKGENGAQLARLKAIASFTRSRNILSGVSGPIVELPAVRSISGTGISVNLTPRCSSW